MILFMIYNDCQFPMRRIVSAFRARLASGCRCLRFAVEVSGRDENLPKIACRSGVDAECAFPEPPVRT